MKCRLILCLVVLGALIGFGVTAGAASAEDTPVTLAPGATTRIPIRLWCLDFGKPYPTAIAGPVSRPPDAALLVLQAALARGATESNPYQTQLAIWRATDGTFHDPAGEGFILAQEIYSDSLQLTATAAPTNTLELAVSQGSVKVTFENFKPISDTAHSELLPYTGTADLVVVNTSSESVTFIPMEGMVFKPASDMNEQSLISHLDVPAAPPTLPTTGGSSELVAWIPLLLVLALEVSVIGFGFWRSSAGQTQRR